LVLWAHEVDTNDYRERLGEIEAGLDAPVVVERLAATAPADAGPSMSDRPEQDPRS